MSDSPRNCVRIQAANIYSPSMPSRMAWMTPDFASVFQKFCEEVASANIGAIVLTDCFRSKADQDRAHYDYKTGKKRAFSPPSGKSMHEAARAIDIDIGRINDFSGLWRIASKYGITPIIPRPDRRASEAWHFECRGSFTIIRDALDHNSMVKAAISAVTLDDDHKLNIQSMLIRLGENIGGLDGIIGSKTEAALKRIGGIDAGYAKLRERFSSEFASS